MADVIGDLLVRVRADVSDMTSGLASASRSFDSAGSAMMGVGGRLTAGVSAPLLGIGLAAVSAASDFESNMNTFQAGTRATGEEMGRLGDLAVALGGDLALPGTSAADAAEAMTELARAGLSVEDSMDAARGVLMMSAAAGISNAEAANVAANALNTFGLEGSEAGRVADLLAAGANASSASVQDMAYALQMSGSVAAAAGVPIEDLTTAIGLMANKGIAGSDAGTSLKTMLMRLMNPTSEAAGLMDTLGISIFDASGTMLPMENIVGQFSGALSGMTDQQRNAALATIFGSDAIRAANIVLMGGTEAWDAMSGAVNRQGAAQDLAGSKMQGLSGALEGFKSTVETVLLTAAMPFLESLEGLVRKAADFFAGLGTLNPAVMAIGLALGGVLAIAGPLLLGVGALTMAIGALLSPIGLVVLAIAGLVAIGVALALHWDEITARAGGTWTAIQGIISGVVSAIQGIITSVMSIVGAFMAQHGDEIRSFMQTAWQAIQNIIQLALSIIEATVIPILRGIGTFIMTHSDEILAFLSAAWYAIRGVIDVVLTLIQGILGVALAVIKGDWEGAWTIVKDTAVSIWATIQSTADAMWNALRVVLETIWNAIKAFFESIWNGISSFFTTILTTIETTATNIWNAIKTFFETILTTIETTFQTIWNEISSFFTTILTTIQTTATTIWNEISSFFTTILTTIQTTATTIWNEIKAFFETIWNAIKTKATELWDAIRLAIRAKVLEIQGMFEYRLNLIRDFLRDTWNQVKETATRLWDEIKGAILGILDGLVGDVFGRGAAMVQRFADGVHSAIQRAIDIARELVRQLRELLPGSDAKEGPLSDLFASGAALPATVAAGIAANAAAAERAAARMAASVRKSLLPGDALALAPLEMAGGGRRLAGSGRPYEAAQGLTLHIYNPTAEPSEASIRREMRYLAAGIW
jgi:TP901 family phage tail tape measure protein